MDINKTSLLPETVHALILLSGNTTLTPQTFLIS